MKIHHLCEPVRIEMHLPGGYTRVFLERTLGIGMAEGGVSWDIETEVIPAHLRAIGSRFLVRAQSVRPEEGDSLEQLRAAVSCVEIDELERVRPTSGNLAPTLKADGF